ncbi:hypothetical protein Tsubulata_020210 [Turnera subulata]|uniref:Uncharacterized protein n=1 Tax=Turnera subulata TaxID=218843 RepID=A0A9Q0FNE1_9ROSI|nr:hypothetical protein Tsubulata_020210 [Turnera subulata]
MQRCTVKHTNIRAQPIYQELQPLSVQKQRCNAKDKKEKLQSTMAFALRFSSPTHCLNSRALLPSSVSSNTVISRRLPSSVTSYSCSLSTKDAATHHMKLKHLARASPEGVPGEMTEEESKFVPLNADDPVYGPPALLLLGFEVEEAEKIRQFLKEMDGEFLQLIFCTEDMIPRSLWDAMHTSQPNLETVKVVFLNNLKTCSSLLCLNLHPVLQIAKSLPRICFLSGLSGEEMMMFIDAFPEIGLEPAVFAALVPNSANKPLQELIDEIMGDHEMMVRFYCQL